VDVVATPFGEQPMRLPIEITTQQLKAAESLQELEAFLQSRIKAAERGEFSSKSVDDIFDEEIHEQSFESRIIQDSRP
jgi:hypothetical protein